MYTLGSGRAARARGATRPDPRGGKGLAAPNLYTLRACLYTVGPMYSFYVGEQNVQKVLRSFTSVRILFPSYLPPAR